MLSSSFVTNLPSLLLADAATSTSDPARPWTLSFIIITFMVYLYIGWRSRVRETAGFYVAGQGVPAIANGAATAADWMSAASFISMAGLISFSGADGSVYLMGWTGGYVLLALLLAPYLRKFGQYTVPDFVSARYYSESARIIAAICAIFVSVTYVAGQMKGVGLVFSRFLEVDLTGGVIIGMVIVAFFAVLGGMKGITWTQVVQYFILIVAFLVPSIAIARKLTGGDFTVPQFAFAFSQLATDLNKELSLLGADSYTEPFTKWSKMNVMLITMALMFGTAGLPHVIVRFYTVKNVRAARWSAFWALLFIAILYTAAPALGMFARYNLINSLHQSRIAQVDIHTINDAGETKIKPYTITADDPTTLATANNAVAEARKTEGTQVLYHLEDKKGEPIAWAHKWQITKLLSFKDDDADGRIEMYVKENGDPNGKPIKSEATIDRDIIVLSTPEVAGLPPWVIALVAAGGLAAALSTAAGLLLVISSSMAHDLYIHFVDPKASEAKRIMVGRIMIIFAIIVAGYFGINPPGFVGEVVAFAFGLAAASFFPVIFLGIFDKRTNRQGAVTGMLVGLIFTGAYILACTTNKILPFVDQPWYDWQSAAIPISPQGIGTVGMILSFIVTIVVSRLTPPPPEDIQNLVESVRIPIGSHEPEAHFDESDAEADNP